MDGPPANPPAVSALLISRPSSVGDSPPVWNLLSVGDAPAPVATNPSVLPDSVNVTFAPPTSYRSVRFSDPSSVRSHVRSSQSTTYFGVTVIWNVVVASTP